MKKYGKPKKIVVFDIDGTITKHVSSWRYIHEKLGLWDVLAEQYQQQFLAGKISYRRFCELDAAHWKGMDIELLEKVFSKVPYAKNAVRAVRKLKNEGYGLVAVSTGLQFMAKRVKEEMGFDMVVCNRLNTRKGRLTGGVTINISHGAKGRVLKKILEKFNARSSDMVAVGDSEGDIPMMRLAGYSIAFNSLSDEVLKVSDHVCQTDDFMEVYKKINEYYDQK